MKQKILRKLIPIACLLVSMNVWAYDFEVDGIYYNKLSDDRVSVTYRYDDYNSYNGDIIIPDSITIGNKKYEVYSIGDEAFRDCRYLKKVIIPETITYIGERAFYNCIGLTNLTIPNSVTNIMWEVFSGCSELTTIVLPDSIISIKDYAFHGCINLTSIVIPECVTSIGHSAFQGCSGLTSVTIPVSVTSIGGNAFKDCTDLTSIEFNAENCTTMGGSDFDVFAGCTSVTSISIGEKVKMIPYTAFCGCTGLTNIEIPNSVTNIGASAFRGCSGLTRITIPNSVTSIGDNAFAYCTGLTSVTIPNSVTSIGAATFSGCTGLTNITIPNSITSIESGMFSGCSNLTNVTIPNSVTTIKSSVFYGCCSLKSVIIPDSVKNIEDRVFLDCTELTTIVIPEGITSICDLVFGNCTNLSTITIPNSVTSIGGGAFIRCSKLTSIVIPEGVISIGGSAFYGCHNLTNLTIPNSVTLIESQAFAGIDNPITRNVICKAKTPPTLGSNVFYNNRLTLEVPFASVLTYQAVEAWTKNSNGSFTYKTKEVDGLYYIPKNENEVEVTYKDTNYNSYSGDILIPDTINVDNIKYNVTSIGESAFHQCVGLTNVTIPEGVTAIGGSAFSGCSGLIYIELPSTLKSLEKYAFRNNSNITRTIVCKAKTPPTLGSSVFHNNRLTLEVPFASVLTYQAVEDWAKNSYESITYQGKEVEGLYYLPTSENEVEVTYKDTNYNSYSGDIIIPDTINVDNIKYTVTSIGNDAFYKSDSLTSVVIPKAVTSIGGYAFSGCSNLFGTLVLPDSLKTVGTYAFKETKYTICEIAATTPPAISSNSLSTETSLVLVPTGTVSTYKAADVWSNYSIIAEGSCDIEVTNETGGELAKSILIQTRKNLQNITGLTVHGKLNSVDLELINTNMSSLLHLDITDTDVTEIPAEAFKDIISLMSVKLPKNLQTIGDYAFSGCKVLCGELILPEKLVKIGNYAFQNCYSLSDTLKIPENVTYINSYAFSGCYNIKKLDMTSSIKLYEIGTNAFNGCKAIECVDMTGASRLNNLGSYIFSDCSGLKSVDMTGTKSLTSLNSYIFNGCNSLETVLVPETLETIGSNAFRNCTKLDSLELPAGLKSIDINAFSGCTGITNIDFSRAVALSNINSSAFSGCTSLSVLDLSACESLTSINSSAFSGCSALTTINFPTSLVSIGSNAFANCTSLLQLSVPCTVPPVIENHAEPFAGVDNLACILSIPTDNFFDYYSANYWGGFVDVESKGEIQNEVNSPNEEEGDNSSEESDIPTDEGGDNETGDETDKDQHHHGHKHDKDCHIYYKKGNKKEHAPRLISTKSISAQSETTEKIDLTDMGLTDNGQSLFVGFGESVTYYLEPKEGKEIESVYFNDVDVTSQLVNNTLTVTVTSDMIMSGFVVNLKNASKKLTGDINDDGEVNVTDVVTLYSYILGNTSGIDESVVDINRDGEVNVTDIVSLYSIILNSNR